MKADDISKAYEFQCALFPTKPHSKQKLILESNAKNKIIACGRRFGKTELEAKELIRGAATGEYKKQIVIAPIYKQAIIVFDKIVTLSQTSPIVNEWIQAFLKTPYPKIFFKNGSIIDFGSADNPNSLRGEAYDRVFLDEAGFIKDDAMHAIRPLIFDKAAPFWKIGTPNGKNHFFDDFTKGLNANENFASFNFTSFDNPYISKEELDREVEKYGKESLYIRTEIYAEFLEDQNSVFPWKDIELCVNNELKEEQPFKHNIYSMGVDVAKYEDYTVISIFDVTSKPYKLVYFERFRRMPWTYIKERVNILMQEYHVRRCLVDKTGVGDVVLEQIPGAEGFLFTSSSKMQLINYLAGLIINHDIQIPSHPDIISELKHFEWIKSESGNIKLEATQGFHDDIVCSLALALYTKEIQKIDWVGMIA